jgi:MYXO-CTERM domain-containing protein
VTGYSQANDGTGFLTFVTSSIDAGGGALLWTAKYESPNGDSDATALGLSPDGTRLFVTGESTGSGTSTDYLTLSYDAASGAQRWQAGYDGNADIDKATALAVAPDGSRVYVTGFSSGNATGTDYATLAYDAASGTQLWVTRYNGPADASDEAYAIALSPGGTVVYVTGHSTNVSTSTPKGASYATVAYDSRLGLQRWEARYNVHTPAPVSTTFSGDTAYAIAASPDGSRVIVTGISTSLTTTTDYDFATVAYDTSGTDSPATPVPEVPAVAAFAVIGLGVVALRRLRRWS